MTASITVAVVGDPDVAKSLGKKGTQSDVTLFNAVRDGHAATLVEPTQFPEKIGPLLVALAMADRVVLVVPGLTREVAETLAAIDLFDRPVELAIGPSVGEVELRKLLKGMWFERDPIRPLEIPRLRETIDSWTAVPSSGPVAVPIDHAFPVKGVGTVALGVVRRGRLSAHESLRLYPSPRTVEVRSIQVHDVDVRSAETGERVGVALKGIDAEEIARGHLLAPEGSLPVATSLSAVIVRKCPYYRGTVCEGLQLHLLAGLQFVPVRVGATSGAWALEADRPVAIGPGTSGILADLSAGTGPRLVGRVELTAA